MLSFTLRKEIGGYLQKAKTEVRGKRGYSLTHETGEKREYFILKIKDLLLKSVLDFQSVYAGHVGTIESGKRNR